MVKHQAIATSGRWLPALLQPLKEAAYRRIWASTLFSNSGQFVLGVAAAWEMTRLTTDADRVALVQTAALLPLMLIALPAGAISDLYDRRTIAMAGLGVACLGALGLALFAFAGAVEPDLLLAFCFLTGVGLACPPSAPMAQI